MKEINEELRKKGRTTKSLNNDNVPFNLGNYVKVDTVYSQPDISLVGAAIDPLSQSLFVTSCASPSSKGIHVFSASLLGSFTYLAPSEPTLTKSS